MWYKKVQVYREKHCHVNISHVCLYVSIMFLKYIDFVLSCFIK